MKLAPLLDALRRHDLLLHAPDGDPEISGIAVDSRQVQAGGLFVAVRGSVTDGHDFIPRALAAGATALVVERGGDGKVPEVIVRDGRLAAQLLAEVWYRWPARECRVLAVTGTNGKTTTTALVRHLLNAHADAGSIGTLGAFDGADRPVASSAGSLTTPGPLDLQATLRAMVDAGVRCVTMEASSHALDQHRLDALTFAGGVFTNLTRDHLDYHGSMAAYREAKLRLADLVADDGILAVNIDDPAWQPLLADRRTISWGTIPGAAVTARSVVSSPAGSRFVLGGRFGECDVELPLPGDFNVANALGAATLALGLGVPLATVADRLARAPQVPGRMELLTETPCHVLRDYAHTPDALERALRTLRPITRGRLVVVFGCGGDRDKGKRPMMGALAAALADRAIVTSDNPRTEDPDLIIDDVVAGMPEGSYERESDRRAAIARALAGATPGDTVLLAGKGHETYQVIGHEYLPFDERDVVREVGAQ